MNLFESIILNEGTDDLNIYRNFYRPLNKILAQDRINRIPEETKAKLNEEFSKCSGGKIEDIQNIQTNLTSIKNDDDFEKYFSALIEKCKDPLNKLIDALGEKDNFNNLIKSFNDAKAKRQSENPSKEPINVVEFINNCISRYHTGAAAKNIANMFDISFYNCLYKEINNGKDVAFYCIDNNTKNICGGFLDKNTFERNWKLNGNNMNSKDGKAGLQQAYQAMTGKGVNPGNFYNNFQSDVEEQMKFANYGNNKVSCQDIINNSLDHNFYYENENKAFTKNDLEAYLKSVLSNSNQIIPGNINLQAVTNFIKTEAEKIAKKYAKHPYANAVVEEMKKNMTGDKYIKIGNPAYHEAVEFLKMRAKNVAFEKLNEDTNDVKDISSSMMKSGVNLVEAIYGTPKNLEWENKDFLKCVAAAKKGDQSAIGYLMYKHAPLIVNSYWKNFLGPNPKMRKIRIERDGGLKSSLLAWIGIALKALVEGGVDVAKKNGGERHRYSTLEGFRPRSVKGKPENAFSSHFRMDLITNAIAINNREDADGITNADAGEITTTNLEFDNGRERDEGEDDAFVRDSLEDEIIKKIEDDDFMQNWLNYCQDEELLDGKKCTPSKALWKILTNPAATNMKEIAEECGVSRGTFESLAKKAIDILPKYEIDYRSLMDACDRYGNKKIASYLSHR